MASKKSVIENTETFGHSIDRFADAATQFAITQATHNQRLNGVDIAVKQLQDDIRSLQSTQTDQHRYMNTRVDKVHEDLTRRIDDIDHKLDTQTVTLTQHIDAGMSSLKRRMSIVERWRYLILGGAIVVMFIFGEIILKHSSEFLDILK